MKKKCKIIFPVLFLFFTCAGMISSSFADPPRDPQDAVIQQVMRATGEDLGFGEEGDYDVPDACTLAECNGAIWLYDANNGPGGIEFQIITCAGEQGAAEYTAYYQSSSSGWQAESFHGTAAWSVLSGFVYPMGEETE